MIEIKPGRYFSTFWFVSLDDSDMLGVLFRDPGEKWHLIWRMRYYAPHRRGPFDSDDKKHWYEYEIDDDEPMAIKYATQAFGESAKSISAIVHEIPVRSDDPEAVYKALKSMPWAHFSEEF